MEGRKEGKEGGKRRKGGSEALLFFVFTGFRGWRDGATEKGRDDAENDGGKGRAKEKEEGKEGMEDDFRSEKNKYDRGKRSEITFPLLLCSKSTKIFRPRRATRYNSVQKAKILSFY